MKYIDTTDLPSDPNGSLANLRREVRIAYNHNRDNPEKLELLAETLRYVLGCINIESVEGEVKETQPEPVLEEPKQKPKLILRGDRPVIKRETNET